MVTKVLQTLVALVLLVSPPISGDENFLVCKNIEEVFENEPSDSDISRLRGPPGRDGQQGEQGPPGLPGIQGNPGTPATVDYDRLSEMIKEQVRQGLAGMNTTVGDLQSKVAQLLKDKQCKEENGLPYAGKCYMLYTSTASELSYEQAVQKCSAEGAAIAEIHSIAHQQAVQDFFELRISATRNFINVALGMTYRNSGATIIFSSGKEVSVNQFRWHTGYPSASASKTRVGVQISHRRNDGYKWFFNFPTSSTYHGVLCERNL